jgi:hypothetical protein
MKLMSPNPFLSLILMGAKATYAIPSRAHSRVFGRNVSWKLRLEGGAKGHNINKTSFARFLLATARPGSPALWAGSTDLTIERDALIVDRNVTERTQGWKVRAMKCFLTIDRLDGYPLHGLKLSCEEMAKNNQNLGQTWIIRRHTDDKVFPIPLRHHHQSVSPMDEVCR